MALDTAFLSLYADLPRQSVGADWCTQEAIGRLPPLRKPTTVMDLGCGAGRSTILLARRFRGPIAAIDYRPDLLDRLSATAKAAGLAARIALRCEDPARLKDRPGTYDLIWSEGCVQALGWEKSLKLWGPLLRARGVIALSDRVWLTDKPPAEVRDFWAGAYPAMADAAGYRRAAEQAGLSIFDSFTLPRATWWEGYYAPLIQRIAALEDDAATNPALAREIEAAKRDIAILERFGDCFAYSFYLLRLS